LAQIASSRGLFCLWDEVVDLDKELDMKKRLGIVGLFGLIIILSCYDNADLNTKMLLSSERVDIIGRPIVYPTQHPAEISSAIRVLQPGEETGWHKHMVPAHAYILQGEISIEYKTSPSITQTVSKGDAFLGVTDV